jgi:hypothetical protein
LKTGEAGFGERNHRRLRLGCNTAKRREGERREGAKDEGELGFHVVFAGGENDQTAFL